MSTEIANYGIAGAVILVVGMFLAYLRYCQKTDREEREKERENCRRERIEERDKLTNIIANDLAHVGESLVKVGTGLDKVNASLDENTRVLRDLNN